MNWLADIFPTVGPFLFALIIVCLMITRSNLASGSESAGPMVPIVPDAQGLMSQAWAVSSIAADLEGDPDRTLTMVRSCCRSVGVDDSQVLGTPEVAVEVLIDRLERHLELDPLTLDRDPPIGGQVLSPGRPQVSPASTQDRTPKSNQDGAPDDN